ncbi:MAG: hypothetical protein NT069_10665 [Planctomycetota bacterium]|nr:hypothetical protein [Planctomycetota bacterium]
MSTVTRETPPARPTVFVALPTSDLRGKKDRSAVAEALTQAGYRVVPSVAYPIGDRAAYQAAIDRDLAESLLFVQVLGQLGTPLSNEPPFTWEGLQFARAKARGIPCLRWRPKDKEFDLAAIEQFENVHYQYLTDAVAVSEIPLQDDERVQAGFLEDFRLAVEQRLKRILAVPVPTKTTAAAAASSDLEILLAPFHDDGPVADTFDTLIEQHAISYVVDDDQELQKAFREQAGVVVIWGNSSREWVDARAKEARRLAMGPGRPLLALYVGHPDPHRELVPRPSKFDIIPDGDPDALQKFVEKLRLKRQQSTTGGQS